MPIDAYLTVCVYVAYTDAQGRADGWAPAYGALAPIDSQGYAVELNFTAPSTVVSAAPCFRGAHLLVRAGPHDGRCRGGPRVFLWRHYRRHGSARRSAARHGVSVPLQLAAPLFRRQRFRRLRLRDLGQHEPRLAPWGCAARGTSGSSRPSWGSGRRSVASSTPAPAASRRRSASWRRSSSRWAWTRPFSASGDAVWLRAWLPTVDA